MNKEKEKKTDIIISVENLSKTFGHFKALDDLSFQIKKGNIYGLIGPNGAGKTTVINILLGILNGDGKEIININGYSIPKDIKKCYSDIGYMPQELSLYDSISVKSNLNYFGKLQGLSKNNLKERISYVLKLVDLEEFGNRIISKCSSGMRRRTSLAVALLHDPKILILDEPTVGIDPELRITFWKYFRELAENGKTIMITTHYLAESKNCNIVGLINKKIIETGTPLQLQQRVQKAMDLDELPDMEKVFVYFTRKERNERNEKGGKKDNG